MPLLILLILALAAALVGFQLGSRRPIAVARSGVAFHSTPDYYGWYVVCLTFAPAVVATPTLLILDRVGVIDSVSWWVYAALWIAVPLLLTWPVLQSVRPRLRARNFVERVIYAVLLGASSISILTTVGIVLSVFYEAMLFFRDVSVLDFLFGADWARGQAFEVAAGRGAAGCAAVGAVPLFAGTLMITVIALVVAVPVGVFSAVYLSEYAPTRARRALKPMLEILAGIPTVVYGFFAAITVAPLVVDLAALVGLEAAGNNALAPGVIMGVMIIPFMSSLSDDVISSVPTKLRSGALALGSTKAESIKKVVLPAALPGIVSAGLLSFSRAVGETMIVVMAAGQGANLAWSPLEPMTTVTVQIVAALTGDIEFDSAFTRSAFALGLTLALFTLLLNVVAALVIRRFRQQYE